MAADRLRLVCARATARSNDRSTAVCIAAPGCWSGFRCSSPPSAWPSRWRCERPSRLYRRHSTRPALSRSRATSQRLFRTARRDPPEPPSARQWFADQVANFGLRVRREPFFGTIPGRGRVRLENLIVTIPGRSPQALAVLAHLDDVAPAPAQTTTLRASRRWSSWLAGTPTRFQGDVPPGAAS